jgi:hypothetical protein
VLYLQDFENLAGEKYKFFIKTRKPSFSKKVKKLLKSNRKAHFCKLIP